MNNPTQVTRSRFEINQDGQTSYLEFETDGHGRPYHQYLIHDATLHPRQET